MATADTGSSRPQHRNASKLDSEQRRFGGVKIGCAFFGWLTAAGLTVLLAALITAVGAAMGLGRQLDTTTILQGAPQEAANLSSVILALILLASYYCGGYVAGRMARFNGTRQGLAVWLWAIVIALVLGLLSLVAANQSDVLSGFNGFPRIPLDGGTLTATGLVALLIAVIVPLIGALLGGLAGMRFHRRVDHLGVHLRNAN